MMRACGLHVSTRLCLLSYGRICFCSCTVVLARAKSWVERICMDGFVCTFCCSSVYVLTRVRLCTLVFFRCTVGYCVHAKDPGRPTPLVFGWYEQVFCSSLFSFLVCQLRLVVYHHRQRCLGYIPQLSVLLFTAIVVLCPCAICPTFMHALTRSCVGICANLSILGVHVFVYEHGCENVSRKVTSRCVRGYLLAREEYTCVWMSLRSLLRR